MRHLDETGYALLAKMDPEATAYFADHLAEPCERCEAFLAGREDALGAAADATLHRETDGTLDALGYRRIRPGRSSVRRAASFAVAALAAVLLAVLVLPRSGGPREEEGIKTAAEPLALELSAVLQTPDGRLQPLAPGAQVPDDGTVLLRYRASAAGRATLRLERSNGSFDALASFDVQPGLHDLEANGEAVGITLHGETGQLRLVVDVATSSTSARATLPLEVVPAR